MAQPAQPTLATVLDDLASIEDDLVSPSLLLHQVELALCTYACLKLFAGLQRQLAASPKVRAAAWAWSRCPNVDGDKQLQVSSWHVHGCNDNRAECHCRS